MGSDWKRVDLRASDKQRKKWMQAATKKGMNLSVWIRLVLDEAAKQKTL